MCKCNKTLMVKSQITELETITMGVITEANINKFNGENIRIHLFNII